MNVISIFHYTDYRAFLKDALQALKEKDSKMSQRWIQQRLGVKTSGWLADLLAGRRKLGRPQLEVFARILNLSAREELYFQTLVDYMHATSTPNRNRAFEKLASFHEVPRDIIDPDRFEYFGKWYYGAIRELLLIEPYKGDPARLARSLNPPITPAQAKEAISVLERLGMVKRYASGELRPSVEHVKKASHFGPDHYYRYIRAQMELGLDAVERISKDERAVSEGHARDRMRQRIAEALEVLMARRAGPCARDCVGEEIHARVDGVAAARAAQIDDRLEGFRRGFDLEEQVRGGSAGKVDGDGTCGIGEARRDGGRAVGQGPARGHDGSRVFGGCDQRGNFVLHLGAGYTVVAAGRQRAEDGQRGAEALDPGVHDSSLVPRRWLTGNT